MSLVGSPLPHSGTECNTVSLEQSNSVLQQEHYRPNCLAYQYVCVCTGKVNKNTKPLV